MKKVILSLFAILISGILYFSAIPVADAATRVNGYYRKSGTYVQPYYRSDANNYKFDNWSSKGNYNPYTGKKGYKSW